MLAYSVFSQFLPVQSNHSILVGVSDNCWNSKVSRASHQAFAVALCIFGRDYVSCWIPLRVISPSQPLPIALKVLPSLSLSRAYLPVQVLSLPNVMDTLFVGALTCLPISSPIFSPPGPVVDISGNQLMLLGMLSLKFHCFGKVSSSRNASIAR